MTPLAAELRLALQRRGRNATSVARECGLSPSSVHDILSDGRVPTLDTAELISEALDWVPIATITRDLRTKVCPVCGSTFVDRGRANTGSCCSIACSRTHYVRRVRRKAESENLRGRVVIAENRLRVHQDAVMAFCMACTARTLLCPSPGCELRPVSPARLPERRVA